MTAAFVLFGFIVAVAVTYLFLVRKHKSNYLALAEYWVYLPGVKMPAQEEIMDIMLQKNPYHRRGVCPIGPKEGLIFSDIRTHIALVLRSKNPHIFRPDLFEEHIKPSAEILEALKDAKSLVKLRYASDIPLKNKTHLQFLVHAADAVAEIGESKVIFDVKAERLMTRKEFQKDLKENFDATVCGIHTQVIWTESIRSGVAETRGLNKIGVSELRTGDLELDQRVIATNVLNEAIRTIWEQGALPEMVEVSTFDDTFKVQFEKMKDAVTMVRILRVQAN